MKKTNFTLNSVKKARWAAWLTSFLFVLFWQSNLDAQCTLVCVGTYNIGFDSNTDMCEIELVAADLVSNVTNTCATDIDDLEVHILDKHHNLLNTDGIVSYGQIGLSLKYKIFDPVSGNSCWGWLVLEDKNPPVLNCPDEDMQIYCYEEVEIEDIILDMYLEDDCDEDIQLQLINQTVTTNNCNRGWGPDTLSCITRVYRAVDSFGNVSEPCTIKIWVVTIEDLGDIMMPDNLLKIEGEALKCDENFPTDMYGHPSPKGNDEFPGTGVPFLVINEGVDTLLYPTDGTFCNLIVEYSDDVIETDCVKKIMRTWTIVEWSCMSPQRSRTHVQMIEIVDDNPPTVQTPADFTASTGPHDCYANVFFPKPVVSDPCDNPVTVSLTVEGEHPSFHNPFNGGFVKLGLGENLLIITAQDKCGNATMDTTRVTVEDKTPPVAVCKTYTTVALSTDGLAKVPAHVFDNGSHDECKLNGMKVKRMDGTELCGVKEGMEFDEDGFSSYVVFCCEDVGTEVMVIFRVWDKVGNYNDCMVRVEVQDKLPPSIVCPPNLEVSCDFEYIDLNVFGTVRGSKDEVEGIMAPMGSGGVFGFSGNIGVYTDGYAEDNCDVVIEEKVIPSLDQCGIGTIYRWFIATDPGGLKDSCLQTIVIVNNNPVTKGDIIFPEDIDLVGCFDPEAPMFSPDELGYPILPDHTCALLGISYKDEVYPFNNTNGDACFKIIRNWKVIDWCQMESTNGHSGFKTFGMPQVIKVSNTEAPTILGDFDRVEVCVISPVCAEGTIDLSASATDDCTETLKASYIIDLDNDGTIDLQHSVKSNTISVEETLPAGSHRIIFTFEDFCGNKTSQEQLFDIVNCKPPTPLCYDGLAVDLMEFEDGGMVELWASDFDAKSYHVCEDYRVIMSFSPDTTDKSKIFTCDDLGMNDVMVYASIVTPGGQLFQDFCIARLDVQDNMMVCPEGPQAPRVVVRGMIATEDERRVENVKVSLMGSELPDNMTSDMGTYAFPDMPSGGNYTVMPQKTDEHLNGVSTLDLVLIQRHILGISRLDSPYKWIAADINNDKAISSTDIIELRKTILGIYSEFKSNSSWRFIDKGHQFEAIEDALQGEFPETYPIVNLQSSMEADFIGVKIGDVSGDAFANRRDRDNTRSRSSVDLIVAGIPYQSGDRLSLPLQLRDAVGISGLQMAIQIHPSIEFISVEGIGLAITQDHYHFDHETRNLTISWNENQGGTVSTGNGLLKLNFIAKSAGHTRSAMSINNKVLNAEVYDAGNQTMNLSLIAEEEVGGVFQLHQNTPNPFNYETEIRFVLPEDMHVVFTVFDVTGRNVHQRRGEYTAGLNMIRISKADIQASGILYYQIEAGGFIASRKMVVIQ